MADLLFVYGTLRSQFDNDWARALRERARFIGPASTQGSLFRVGDFPAYRPGPAGTVHGELYETDDPDDLFTLLDEYESEIFSRVSITLDDGREAWIYQYESEPPLSARIESGDFSNP